MKTAIKVTKMEFLAPNQQTFSDCIRYMVSHGVKLNGFIVRPFSREEFRDHPNVNTDCMIAAESVIYPEEED